MLNPKQIRELVIRPTLKEIGLYTVDAENLLVGTFLIESRLTFLKQNPTGPALGLCQMEPATYKDLLLMLQKPKNIPLLNRILTSLNMTQMPLDSLYLITNLKLAVIMCRLKYFFNPEAIPTGSIEYLAAFYKKIYNTPQGAADVKDFIKLYKEFGN